MEHPSSPLPQSLLWSQRWSGTKAFGGGQENHSRKTETDGVFTEGFTHRLVLEAIGSDHGLSQVQNISSYICKWGKRTSRSPVGVGCDGSFCCRIVSEHSRWHFMATVISMFILIFTVNDTTEYQDYYIKIKCFPK